MVENIIEKIKEREDFSNWVRENRLNPFQYEEPKVMLGYHGTFQNQIEEINKNKNNAFNHGVRGLYLSTSNREVSAFYADPNNKRADYISSLEDLKTSTEEFVKRMELKKYFGEEIAEELRCYESVPDIMYYILENTSEEDFENIFKQKKEDCLKKDSEEIITDYFMQNQGIIYPFLIKMNKPAYIINPEFAQQNHMKSTFIMEPFVDSEGFEYNVEELNESSIKSFNSFFEEIGLENNLREEVLNEISNCHLDYDYIKDFLEDILSEDYDWEDAFEENFNELGVYGLYDEYQTEDIKEAQDLYQEIRNILVSDESISQYTYEKINQILEEMSVNNERIYLHKVLHNNITTVDFMNDLEEILDKVFDGFVYCANDEFDYVKEGFNEDYVFHFVANKAQSVKGLYNKTFSDEENIRYRKYAEELVSQSDKINFNQIINRFQKVYPAFPEVELFDSNSNESGFFNKRENKIYIAKNNIKSEKDLKKTLLHEYVVHGNIEKYTENNKAFLFEVYNYAKKQPEFNKIKESYGFVGDEVPKSLKDKKLIAEEYLAYCAENKLYLKDKIIQGFFEKLKDMVSEFKIKFGIDDIGDRINKMIVEVDEGLKNKKRRRLS